MKKLILIAAMVISGVWYNAANAQIRLHVGLNFGYPRVYIPARVVVAQPAPPVCEQSANYDDQSVSYNNDADDYYYIPDVDAYYSVPNQCYYYNDGGSWVSASYLPGAYRDYDWRSMRHYEVRAPRPYMHDDFYRARFNGAAFGGKWGEDRFDNRVNTYNRPMEYNRDRRYFDRHDDFRGHVRFERGDFRHGRS